MRKLLTSFLLIAATITTVAQVGINTTTPDASSMLDITATDKGILIPRMSAVQRIAIGTPATGLLVYQTDAAAGFWYYNGTAWVNLNNGEFKSIGGLVQNTTNTTADDFVFGSTSLADITGTNDDNRMFYDKSKGAFRAGTVDGTQWNDANIGTNSIALGYNARASGGYSTAMGQGSISSNWVTTAMGYFTNATAVNATAMGNGTTASGQVSTAMGRNTVASGWVSTAMGDNNTAPSYSETVLGAYATTYTPVSTSTFDTADRIFTVGNGISTARSNAMTILKAGRVGIGIDIADTSALLDLSSTNKGMLVPRMTAAQRTAITTPATGLLVYQTDASPGFWYYSGTAWTSFGSEFKSIGGLVQNTTDTATDDFVFGSTSLADLSGSNDNMRMFFDKSKGAFRAGYVTSTHWDDANVGQYSVAFGGNTMATGQYSTALGIGTTASGHSSTTMGENTTAAGSFSVAMGESSSAGGPYSMATGSSSSASGWISTAMGDATVASGYGSTTMGYLTNASGGYTTAMGYQTVASGDNTTAMGDSNEAPSYAETVLGSYATAYTPVAATSFNAADRIFSVGNGTSSARSNAMTIFKSGNFVAGSSSLDDIGGTADDYRMFFNKGKGAFRAGRVNGTQWNNTSVGVGSAAMGYNTIASGDTSTSMGANTTASGQNATAMGSSTTASGSTATAMGVSTFARSFGEIVVGIYATDYAPASTTAVNANDRVFCVGNGTSTAATSNAMTILKNGRVGIGTATPTRAMLEIIGGGNGQGGIAMVAHTGGSTGLGSYAAGTYGAPTYSIWATSNIAATQFHAYSDARIKKILDVSDSANDLQTLEKIEITNYKMADSLQLGNKPIKKVIAQQIEKVYPQAVANNLTEAIPNIYKVSEIKNGWIDLVADVKVGDKVKLLFDGSEKLVTVIEVSPKGFKVNTDTEGAVFIYGKQVNDFRAVDYEALSMLNISATQELLKRIKGLEADKTNLTTKVKTLEQNQANINARLEQLEGFILKKAASVIDLSEK